MYVSLPAEVQRRIEKWIESGRYSTPEEVISAAIIALEQAEVGEFAPGELDLLLAEGESSIDREGTLDGEEAFRLRQQRRRS